MVAISEQKLELLFKSIRKRKVIVLGDLMLDRYIAGLVHRISPEAPVPVVEVENEFVRLGGAANVVYNVRSLGAIPVPIGVVGADFAGEEIVNLLKSLEIETDSVIVDSSRPTVMKTRIIANDQHVVRADWESRNSISQKIEARVARRVAKHLIDADALIIEDYNKGLLSRSLIREVIKSARRLKKIVTIDPKFDNFFAYQDVTVFKPNRKEVEAALGMHIDSQRELQQACENLAEKLHAEYILVTLGEKGMCLYEKSGNFMQIPTRARKVHDVSGAGDTVISSLTLALASDADIREAMTFANYAAGAVCGEVGVVPVTQEMIREAIAFFR
ncbi:MAG: D-glycero-beta-D-manno-heptose-7-phosphate kinase [Calditrichaeota bacterium]|nr:D-glycero-beta-D-manno-heptose-7-phosphate kinase [Calditrichota bacterium]